MKAGARLAGDRQQLAISPEVLRPPGDLFAGQVHRAVVVDRFQGGEAAVADVQRLRRKRRVAEMTLQPDEGAHTRPGKGTDAHESTPEQMKPYVKNAFSRGEGVARRLHLPSS